MIKINSPENTSSHFFDTPTHDQDGNIVTNGVIGDTTPQAQEHLDVPKEDLFSIPEHDADNNFILPAGGVISDNHIPVSGLEDVKASALPQEKENKKPTFRKTLQRMARVALDRFGAGHGVIGEDRISEKSTTDLTSNASVVDQVHANGIVGYPNVSNSAPQLHEEGETTPTSKTETTEHVQEGGVIGEDLPPRIR